MTDSTPLERVRRFVRMWREKPLKGIDDEVYGIHTGTEWEASLRVSDVAAIVAALDASGNDERLQDALRFDEPDAFEAWWQTYKHKNRELANYSIKKCIAFDAFHEALQQARAAIALTQEPEQ